MNNYGLPGLQLRNEELSDQQSINVSDQSRDYTLHKCTNVLLYMILPHVVKTLWTPKPFFFSPTLPHPDTPSLRFADQLLHCT